ncbi:properdin [Tachysurus ichikawai]
MILHVVKLLGKQHFETSLKANYKKSETSQNQCTTEQVLNFRALHEKPIKRTIMHIILLFVLVLHVQETVSQMVRCYATFHPSHGTCSNILGEVSQDDCCMNPAYGYLDKDNVCKSCRIASWSTWSPWSACSVTCTEGVTQRKRACYGFGSCRDPHLLGNIQTKPCEDISCCPENGGWSEWGPWQLCSVTCEKGFKKRTRTCSNPPPKCGGGCEGDGEEVGNCDTGIVCPTHGGWSAWGQWSACSSTCKVEGGIAPQQQRYRTCTNPPPSVSPRGNNCPDSDTGTQHCTGLPFCSVNGNWGAWFASSECSVTCGVGLQTRRRNCDNPAPKYGGQACPGDDTKAFACTVPKRCPVDGQWTEWSEWSPCESSNKRDITCKLRMGRRRRLRECEGKKYDGNFCDGDGVTFGHCYDIQGCKAGPGLSIPTALWTEWSNWSYCKPHCGEHSKQTRKRECIPDISKYSEQNIEIFSGKADITCTDLEEKEEARPCRNLPPC